MHMELSKHILLTHVILSVLRDPNTDCVMVWVHRCE